MCGSFISRPVFLLFRYRSHPVCFLQNACVSCLGSLGADLLQVCKDLRLKARDLCDFLFSCTEYCVKVFATAPSRRGIFPRKEIA